MIKLFSDTGEVDVRWINFSDGSSNVKIGEIRAEQFVSVAVTSTSVVDKVYFQILLVLDALRRKELPESVSINLSLKYLPHARADQVFEEGNPLPLRVFCQIFEYFDTVFLTDPHSDAWKAFCNPDKVWLISQFECFRIAVPMNSQREVTIVAPDKGALAKAGEISEYLMLDMVVAEKRRCIETGRILETTLVGDPDIRGQKCVIVDDIADGGGTFIPLAKLLKERGAASVELYVTHGIFAKGLQPFVGVIDKIWMYQPVGSYITRSDILNFNEGVF